jgi:hypothetical protein
MKIVSAVARYLLGFVFVVFGLNGFLHFIPMQPESALANQFLGALAQSHYIDVVFALELVAGLLLLVNSYVPLALTLLAPVIFNIVLFHVSMAPGGIPLAVVTVLLWLVVAYTVRVAFSGLLLRSVAGTTPRANRRSDRIVAEA